MDLSIVIVNWNVEELLAKCLKSLYENTKETCFEVIIVDNDSTNKIEKIQEEFPQIKLILNKVNVGFAKANNQAIKEGKGRYFLLLNPDTIVLDQAIDKMVIFMNNHREVGICGPKLLNKDGSLQYSCYSFPTLWNQFCFQMGLHKLFPDVYIFSSFNMRYWDHKNIMEVDYVMGAAFIVRKEAIDEVGLMDGRYFIYFEEVDWAFRIKKAGWKVIYYPEAEIIHYGGCSTRDIKKLNQLYKSKLYFFSKYHSSATVLLHKLFIAMGIIARIGLGSLRLVTFSKNKRKINIQYIKEFGSLLDDIIKRKLD